MTQTQKDLNKQLIQEDIKTPGDQPAQLVFHDFQYKEFGKQYKITLSGLSLILLCPILIAAHLFVAKAASIPIIQYAFITMLISFLINYTFIIRKYELMPYLPQEVYDNKLKKMCVLALVGILSSSIWGWNGSGGIIFAILWEQTRGNKMGIYGYLFGIIIIGSLMMEKNYSYMKLVEFIPGVMFGLVNSMLFTLKQSSTYAMAHQFVFLSSICIPMFFPASHLVVPSLFQWIVMIVTGFTMLATVILTVKLMQSERVSVVMGVMSGIIMLGTSSYLGFFDFAGAIVILVGIALVIKKQYLDLDY